VSYGSVKLWLHKTSIKTSTLASSRMYNIVRALCSRAINPHWLHQEMFYRLVVMVSAFWIKYDHSCLTWQTMYYWEHRLHLQSVVFVSAVQLFVIKFPLSYITLLTRECSRNESSLYNLIWQCTLLVIVQCSQMFYTVVPYKDQCYLQFVVSH